jgi:hypothetical protein
MSETLLPEPDVPSQGHPALQGATCLTRPPASVTKARRKTEDVGRLVSIAMVAPQAFDHTERVGVGRIRARYLTARLPNPPVRPVRETFASYGSRERDIMGHFHFASSTAHSPWTALRVRWVPLYSFPTLSLRAFAMCAAFLRSDYYAPFDCL